MPNYLKSGLGQSRDYDERKELMRPMTPKSETVGRGVGAISVSLQSSEGLCTLHRKCVLKDGHTAPCWPGD